MNDESTFLQRYEKALNPRQPEKCSIPTRVLGYGEISTVLEIVHPDGQRYAYKRMPMFYAHQEVEQYERLVHKWVKTCNEEIGLAVLASNTYCIHDEHNKRFIVYIKQESLPRERIGNQIIKHANEQTASELLLVVLKATQKVYDFNHKNRGKIEIGFDAQISNWAISFVSNDKVPANKPAVTFFDISSPLIRLNGIEQQDSELFLRSAPSFLVWLIRLLFVQDVMTRYYDQRKVVIDLLANLYKEQRADLIPTLLDTVNAFLADTIEPITIKEVRDYYREDAWIWRIYLTFRKTDRFLHRLLGLYYPYILPDKIRR
ncbi:hypothetical protein EH223_17995 [candidate division KSB1 bacterium]|nr:hypothetical protein [candidate division KSB1 bacterium]RQW00641.1 MAG: hypothetical protein EH223_17995 [candidate division KSB1 bacterium]